MILTSGTTGAAKGAQVRRAENLEPLAWFLKLVPIDAGSVCLGPAPLFHAHGLGQIDHRHGARMHGGAAARASTRERRWRRSSATA